MLHIFELVSVVICQKLFVGGGFWLPCGGGRLVLAQVKHALVGLVGSGVDARSTGSRHTRAECCRIDVLVMTLQGIDQSQG